MGMIADEKILSRPGRLYFDDDIRLVRFGKYLQDNLIARPAGADAALRLAGVLSINEVVEAQLTHVPNVLQGLALKRHLSLRSGQLERVLGFHGLNPTSALTAIDSAQYVCVDDIRVRYLAHVFGYDEPLPSEEEHLQPTSMGIVLSTSWELAS